MEFAVRFCFLAPAGLVTRDGCVGLHNRGGGHTSVGRLYVQMPLEYTYQL